MSAAQAPAQTGSFVERFEAAWRSRDPARLAAILHPDVELTQPLARTVKGRPRAMRLLAGYLQLIPDLTITIHHSLSQGELVFIEFSIEGSVGRVRVHLPMVDRIELSNGLVRNRSCYFDPLPILRAVLSQPWLWPNMLRARWLAPKPLPA